MACWTLADGYVSCRWISQHYGFNFRHIETLVRLKVLASNGKGVSLTSLKALIVGTHYVVCQECGAFAGALTDKHLKNCSGITVSDYRKRHQGAPAACKVVEDNRKRSDEQKAAQSSVLRARFSTPAGAVTRKQISDAAKASMSSGYQKQAAEHLKALNSDPARRVALSRESKQRWASGAMAAVPRWHRENKSTSNALIARARGYIRRTFTKPHATLEAALLAAGLPVQREYQVGFYRLDEALPELLLGIEMDGCYWHGCSKCGFPGNTGTRKLDRRKTSYLRNLGWRILRIRECELKRDQHFCVWQVLEAVREAGCAKTA